MIMSESDYKAGVEYLEKRMPEHVLLPSIKRGYGAVNCKYLERALKDVPRVKEPLKKITSSSADPRLNDMYRELGELFTKRNKLSNKFHDMIHLADKSNNSKMIGDVQVSIKRMLSAINHLETTGNLPTYSEEYDLPTDPFELLKKKNNLISARSRVRKEIRELSADAKGNASKISAREIKENDYTIKIDHVIKKLQQAEAI